MTLTGLGANAGGSGGGGGNPPADTVTTASIGGQAGAVVYDSGSHLTEDLNTFLDGSGNLGLTSVGAEYFWAQFAGGGNYLGVTNVGSATSAAALYNANLSTLPYGGQQGDWMLDITAKTVWFVNNTSAPFTMTSIVGNVPTVAYFGDPGEPSYNTHFSKKPTLPAGYILDGKRVYFTGSIAVDGSAVSGSSPVTTLPSGLIPFFDQELACMVATSSSLLQTLLTVDTSGGLTLNIPGNPTGINTLYLTGLNYAVLA